MDIDLRDVALSINNVEVKASPGSSILEVARRVEIYIPSLCYHPDLPSPHKLKAVTAVYRGSERLTGDQPQGEFEGCNLCLVQVEGQKDLVLACETTVADGMRVFTDTEQVYEARREELMRILSKHPHACLICAQKEGCTREPCSTNVPVPERCCPKFGNCELEKVAVYIGIRQDTPRYLPKNLPTIQDEPLFLRDYNLCIGCARCVRACQELRGVKALGFIRHNGEVLVGTIAPTLKESACRFCGACVEVCPTGALMDKRIDPVDREKSLVPCRYACPAEIDVPRYVSLIGQGRYDEALAVVGERVPFPSVLGHACARPCEEVCRSGEVNEPIAICALKRFIADHSSKVKKESSGVRAPTGRRVAIVGSGPAGLTAAYYLARLGHSVTVFEALPKLGGMMRYGVQEYRLPESVLAKDLEKILNLGIEAKTNVPIQEDQLMEDILKGGFDAVLIATGLQRSRMMKVEGVQHQSVLGGLGFLKQVRLGKTVEIRDKVLVIGGGNVAVDVALTAFRLGAKRVQVACLESYEQMPAFDWEIQQAIEEGIAIHNSWGVNRILWKDENLAHVELVRCISVFDDDGKFNPSFDHSTMKTVEAETIILAIGQTSDMKGLAKLEGLRFSKLGTIIADKSTMATNVPGVFACGDVVNGPTSIVEAVASGRKAAISIDRHLGGSGNIDEQFVKAEEEGSWLGREEGFANRRRPKMPLLPVSERTGSFAEVELGFDEDMAREEAGRCLRCDLRMQIRPAPSPPERWIKFRPEALTGVPECEGVYQLLDENRQVIYIKGALNLKREIEEQLAKNQKAEYFLFEEAKMFTMRESELLQQFLKKHGRLPEQNVGLEEDLY